MYSQETIAELATDTSHYKQLDDSMVVNAASQSLRKAAWPTGLMC